MPLLQPCLCSCYSLKLPSLPANLLEADEPVKRKMTLESRTGAAVGITRSDIFVHGGLTIPLNLTKINSLQIQKELVLYFAKEKQGSSLFRKLTDWISPEVFFLDLISRSWKRLETEMDTQYIGEHDEVPKLSERFFHSISFCSSCLYIFGGLMVSPQNGYELIASNELWKLDLTTRKWSLISRDPQIARRFAHTMHTKNENIETRDTKLVIVGGLNNMDQPIKKVDIYNLTKGFWESEPNPECFKNIRTNVEGRHFTHVKESNLSILIENNEAKVPTLVIYGMRNDDGTQSIREKNESTSPVVALPILSESKGMVMNLNENQLKSHADIPYNLHYPSGSYFSHSVVMAGFHPNFQASSFQCFVYDISSGKWAKIGTICEDRDFHKHRFWTLFVWHSHHQTILLGTKDDDYNLPSVQKFDWLLSFGLPMVSLYNKLLHSVDHRSTILRPTPNIMHKQHSSPETGSEALDEAIPSPTATEERKLSFASSSTSQFESYIRYIAPPVQMASISSVFPPHAMVLGKDALEIFGKPLSDFEFITEEGDSIGVPIFLLRKRWGRYFDMLLSQGYAKVCSEYEASGEQSEFVRFSTHSSQIAGSSSKPSEASSFGSLENYSKQQQQQQESQRKKSVVSKLDEEKSTTSSSSLLVPEEPEEDVTAVPAFYENDYDDPMSPPAATRSLTDSKNPSSKSIHRIGTTSTTSSSGGMVFRVPFQESSASLTDTRSLRLPIGKEGRRSSSVASPALEYLRPNSNYQSEKLRRASHPDTSTLINDDYYSRSPHPGIRHSITSTRSSRNPSVTSQNSSISFVSSSSDRMGNSIMPQTSNGSSLGSNVLGVLTVPLPPATSAPNEPLPPAPYEIAGRQNSTSEYGVSNRSSPLSSRRPSYDRNYSVPETRFASENFRTSLDSQMLAESAQTESSADNSSLHRSILAKLNPKSGESPSASFMKGSGKNPENNRLSLGSNADSTLSVNSAGFEWEPLLTPRTLYMPWPTATVRAFAEFFYIGQVNGKWSLSPVALNLLIMSKVYEIPLLSDLINEVIYSIIGRKEDSLFVTCNFLMEAIKKRLRNNFNEDESWIEAQAYRNENYMELEKLKHSLENVDNGYVDINLLKRVSRSLSMSTNESEDFAHDHIGGNDSSGTPVGGSHIPTVFAGGPRDSHNSVASIGYPPGVNFQGSRKSSSAFSPRVKKKSSLSKEVNLNSMNNNNRDDPDKLKGNTRRNGVHVDPGYGYFDASSDSSYTSSDSSINDDDDDDDADADDDDDDDADNDKSNDEEGQNRDAPLRSTIIDARSKKDEEDVQHDDDLNKLPTPKKEDEDLDDDSNSSLSDFEELNSDMGLLSLNKMKRKLAGQSDPDESVDPLLKIDSATQSYGTSPNKGSGAKHRGDNFALDAHHLTLEYLTSSNALPPVDYVIKAIYRTAALVNYPRLMVRCLDCIEVSRRLKEIKKRLTYDFASMDQEMKRNAEASSVSSSRDQKFEKPNLEWTSSKGAFQGISPTNMTPKSGTPKVENQRRTGVFQGPVNLSPKSSLSRDDESIKSSASQPKKFLKSKIFGENPAPQASTSAFMNPAFMPPPPSSNKNKKSSSGTSGFSFFGIRK
ncbi:hypothetical protein ZYGR_0AD05820 [Zygosaccharomyces rouxii]|uniref:ZYRO0G19426p n=2 Tax=Zygosaccharomyces rouxii TaxID=4956 RepID=C5E1A8_ZYGRC|nr:uncharacterized protein ZYRO0G19426g [Zygosaccharomyces rouxii]KAH9202885.1 hypothetical protein LQ764DRAFT_222994 [Zygosaccharomyces rouxii]GAV51399.1 hypothetical protein ZYGR_0AD05820 [Zygosaccharomyces rouxii]CAR29892.1 ZYRO0G19426p [Zygosaccharomyces rouxii]